MLLPDESSSSSAAALSCNSSSTDAALLLQVRFDTSSSSTTVLKDGGMTIAITSPSNGTTLESLHFRKGDVVANVSACLARTACYGLELINAERGSYHVVVDGSPVNDDQFQQFPYYMTPHASRRTRRSSRTTTAYVGGGNDDDDDDDDLFSPYETHLTFLEIGAADDNSSSSCVPTCDTNVEDLYEVRTFSGNEGDGSFGWRLEQDGQAVYEGGSGSPLGDVLMGCGVTNASAVTAAGAPGGNDSVLCFGGGTYRVTITRACLPKAQPHTSCRRVVMGHSNTVPAEPSPTLNDINGTVSNNSNLWVGHYHPMFQVSINGDVAASGTSTTFAAADIDDNNCSTASSNACPVNQSLLEIFQYGAVPNGYVLHDLRTQRVVLTQAISNATTPLRHVRQCVPRSGCYDLTFVAAAAAAGESNRSSSSSSPDKKGVSTQVVLDGVYYTNAMVRYVPFHVLLGDTCQRQQACPLIDESLLRIDINMSGIVPSQYVPSFYCAWSVFRESANNAPESVMPEESMSYFSNGYPGRSRVRHSMCVSGNNDPDDGEQPQDRLTFGMLHSVPMEIEWSVTRDGVMLDCRTRMSSSPLGGYVVTPLDGSCPPPVTPSQSSILATALFVGIVGGILLTVVILAGWVYKSAAGSDESSVRRLPTLPWSRDPSDRRPRRLATDRSTARTDSMSVITRDDPGDLDLDPASEEDGGDDDVHISRGPAVNAT